MTKDEFQQVVNETLDEMPDFLRDKLRNIDVVIEEEPIVHKSLLGLYQGVPLKKRGFWYGNVLPDKITLFKNNIERISHNEGEMRYWIRKVVIHEIGHYFGFDEEKLRESGY